MKRFQLFINGDWRSAKSNETFESFNPYTGQPWALIPRCSTEDVNDAVAAARIALEQGEWGGLSATARGRLLTKLGDLIARDADKLAEIEVRDNGKLWAEMRLQVGYLPQWLYYFGGLADKIEGSVPPIEKPDNFAYTRREPVGVVAAITPWNSPLLTTMYKLAPALAAGCTMVLKPSEFTSASLLELMKLVEEAGFPKGVLNVVTGFGADVGEALVTHPDVNKIAFTGGENGGRLIARNAANDFKRLTLELGGKSAQIVFDDAKLDDAVKGAVSGIFAATGQTCIAGSRLMLHESIHDEFVEKFIELARTARMGDPMDTKTQIGPVTTRPQYERILEYIGIAKNEGAHCVLGGSAATRSECGEGWFIEPTIFTNVTNNMRIAREEVFGPVLSVMKFNDDEEAYGMANDTPFGLAAGVWTTSFARAFTASKRLRAGTVWVNTYRAVSYVTPFGGMKRSGIGRENGKEAIDEYLETKTVWISYAGSTDNPFVMR
ncbi:aldehyde dehydrogenase [Caballeronia calidae]|uniref:Aldehyde dehydrogenase n=1 Tax=Caballeronia calidae TaxID=1777139 RepID=A0A158EKC6_9BURK|nr:aldehyde dehydrogenase [Caballeronia calidae]SAL06856.1 aldehyde dehydrogenase [Caballeronia calidae]